MRTLLAFTLPVALALVACGGSSTQDGTGPSLGTTQTTAADASVDPGACTSTNDCNPTQCLCTDGKAFLTPTACSYGRCVDFTSTCTTLCGAHGGVHATRPQPTVIGSAECTAYLAKAKALDCGGVEPDPHFFCGYGIDECAESKRAALQCEIDQGTWSCHDAGAPLGWSESSTCRDFKKMCADAGP